MRVPGPIESAVWLLPASSVKNRLLNAIGHRIHPTAIVRSNLVRRVDRVEMLKGSRIGRFNLLKDLRSVSLGEDSSIGRLNLISSHPVYKRLYQTGARLDVGEGAFITSRHQLDCSGSVSVGDFASIAGHDTKVLSHSIDLRRDAQVAYPVVVGPRSFVGARCLLLGGGTLPENSVLGAGSVLTRGKGQRQPGVWAGAPATRRGDLDGAWLTRSSTHTRRVYDPETGATVEDAF